ncbi:MAG: hypothetical protein HYZ89_04495 [Candidatus Omnitrophica bacterium]|nr:hypothetical protein [Candidatus Omnitrophota bacterium]
MRKDEPWQCQACSSTHVTDRVLATISNAFEIHRLICQRCGAVDHYDHRLAQQEGGPVQTVNGRFRRVAGSTASPVRET